jgi:hypothetical protein
MPKRWYPGHYIHCSEAVGRSGIDNSKRALVANNPNFVGYQVSIWWGQTESTLGNYANLTTQLNAARTAAQQDGKKIWLRLWERSFTGYDRPAPFPSYITAGQQFTSTGGQNVLAPKLYLTAVQTPFLNWCQAAAEYCAANPEFVLISTEEYTIQGDHLNSDFYPGGPAAYDALWMNFAARMVTYAGDCLFHVNTGWSPYFPPVYSTDYPLADALVTTHGAGLGATDLIKDNEQGSGTLFTNFGSFIFRDSTNPDRPGMRGRTFFALQFEWGSYYAIESPAEHLRWAVDDLGVHFITWDPDKNFGVGASRDWTWAQALAAVNAAGGRINTLRPPNVEGGDLPPVVIDPPGPAPELLEWFDLTDPVTGALNWAGAGFELPVWPTAGYDAQAAVIGVAFAFLPVLDSGATGSVYAKVSGPAWASVNASTGEITGTPSGSAGTVSVVVSATNDAGAANITIDIAVALTVSITTTTLPTVATDQAIALVIEVEGTAPISLTLSVRGTLPTSVILVGNTLTGAVAAAGSYTFTIAAAGAVGSDTQALTLVVVAAATLPDITTTALASGTVGTVYTATLAATGAATITYAASGLPAGLSLNASTGAISGTPTAPGFYVLAATATNSLGTDAAALSLTINPSPAVSAAQSGGWGKFIRQ